MQCSFDEDGITVGKKVERIDRITVGVSDCNHVLSLNLERDFVKKGFPGGECVDTNFSTLACMYYVDDYFGHVMGW